MVHPLDMDTLSPCRVGKHKRERLRKNANRWLKHPAAETGATEARAVRLALGRCSARLLTRTGGGGKGHPPAVSWAEAGTAAIAAEV